MHILKKLAVAAFAATSFAGAASASVIQTESGDNLQLSYGAMVMDSVTLAAGTSNISALTSSVTLVDQDNWCFSWLFQPTDGVYLALFNGTNALWATLVAEAKTSVSTQTYNIAKDGSALADLNAALDSINWAKTPANAVKIALIGDASGFPIWTLDVKHEEFSVTSQVPEPGSIALLGLGVAGIGFARRKAKRA